MPEKGSGKWQSLLADPDVRRWFDNLKRGSPATADNYLRILGRFLELNDLTPKKIVALKPRERDDIVTDHITRLLKEGKTGSTAAVVKKAIISWLDWNGKKLTRKIKVPGVNHRPTLRDAHIPTQEELKRVLNAADARARAATSLMAYSGVRPEVLGNYLGTDGLRVKDLPEALIEKGQVVFDKVPTRLVVPERMSKTGRPYFTFLGQEGCAYLAAYLGKRAEAGEKLSIDSPIITPRNVEKPFMRSVNIGDLIRKPMRAAGLSEPPYIWRSYFSSRAMLAEGKGFTRDYRQFCMGHTGDIEHVYALHKRLPPDAVEAMREGYQAALAYLETSKPLEGEDPTLRAFRVLLLSSGYAEEEVDALQLDEKTEEEIVALLRDRSPRPQPAGAPPDGFGAAPVPQRIIALGGLDQALAQGWVFKASLPDGRIVIESPTPALPPT
ncbi:MAG: site-specific integrase [Thermoplasmatota archaeon]